MRHGDVSDDELKPQGSVRLTRTSDYRYYSSSTLRPRPSDKEIAMLQTRVEQRKPLKDVA